MNILIKLKEGNRSVGTGRIDQTPGGNSHGGGSIGGKRSVSFSLRTGHTNQTPGGNSYDGGGIGGNRSVSFFVKTGHIY